MNSLPVSIDLTSHSSNKPKASASESRGAEADSFEKELSKQERNTQDKVSDSKSAHDAKNSQNDVKPNSKGASVAADVEQNGEELPEQAASSEYADISQEELSGEMAHGLSLSELDALESQQAAALDPEATDSTDPLTLISETEEDSALLNASAVLGNKLELANSVAEASGNLSAYSQSVTLSQSMNPTSAMSGAAASAGALSDDALLSQPTEKLMTLEQLKASLEKGVESLAELEVDVDIDGEANVKEVFRFNDIQLKESQSTLKTYTTSVDLPVSQGAWGDKVNDKIIWLANQKIQFAEIHLNPQDLGPMEVKINVQNDQATVTFNSQHQGVRELLEMNVSRLREMMSENGVDLAHVDVSDQSSQQQSGEDVEGEGGGQSGSDGEDSLSRDRTVSDTDSITLDNLVDFYA
ncbi:flagellar hook-length control protein FliK [Alkalimarinus coralli]|uniref:flagellar hook-length control protein FliK n=1 Tax=Alkalimarinus coralli TaxID=2935863 RepID=UPI00202AF250|nr:flagellar hook-length control protein FliK [Alkalimarinus coralli]